MRRPFGIIVLLAAFAACAPRTPPDAGVLIFAAASLQTALEDLSPQIARATGTTVRTSYAASSALARQIESGAPADIFMSADLEWMDYLQQRGEIQPPTRVNLLGNALVLVAPSSRASTLTIAPGFPLATALGDGRLAIADPDVPAGRYARAALTSLGVWNTVSERIAPAENVRAALLLVSRGEAPFGIVYRTDAVIDRGVSMVGTFPPSSHPPIVYPAALTTSAVPLAARVLEFLRSESAAAVFTRHGFDVLVPPQQ